MKIPVDAKGLEIAADEICSEAAENAGGEMIL